jgi:hypothetical protein
MSDPEYEPDPLPRLRPSFFAEASPEAELTVREVGRAAAVAAKDLINAWGKRPTAEWVDPGHDENSLFAVVDLERHGESPSVELKSLPLLPEAPPSWESGRTLTGELADLRTALPFADDELTILRNGLATWSRAFSDTEGPERPTLTRPELLVTWQEWLREPPDADGLTRVRPDALAAHVLCLRLRDAVTIALTGSDNSVRGS